MTGPTGPAEPQARAKKPDSTNERLVIYLPIEVDRRLRVYAAGNRKSLSEVATEAIEAFLVGKPA